MGKPPGIIIRRSFFQEKSIGLKSVVSSFFPFSPEGNSPKVLSFPTFKFSYIIFNFFFLFSLLFSSEGECPHLFFFYTKKILLYV